MFCKAVSYIDSAVDTGQCTFTYIGETYRQLSTGIVEHKGISVRTGQTLLKPLNSIIRDKAFQTGQDINASCFKVQSSTLSIFRKAYL